MTDEPETRPGVTALPRKNGWSFRVEVKKIKIGTWRRQEFANHAAAQCASRPRLPSLASASTVCFLPCTPA